MNVSKYFYLFLQIFIWIVGLFIIAIILYKVTGHSPTLDEISLAILTLIGIGTIGLISKVASIESEIKWFKRDVRKEFNTIYRRFDAVNERFDGVDKRFNAVDYRFEKIDKKLLKIERKIS